MQVGQQKKQVKRKTIFEVSLDTRIDMPATLKGKKNDVYHLQLSDFSGEDSPNSDDDDLSSIKSSLQRSMKARLMNCKSQVGRDGEKLVQSQEWQTMKNSFLPPQLLKQNVATPRHMTTQIGFNSPTLKKSSSERANPISNKISTKLLTDPNPEIKQSKVSVTSTKRTTNTSTMMQKNHHPSQTQVASKPLIHFSQNVKDKLARIKEDYLKNQNYTHLPTRQIQLDKPSPNMQTMTSTVEIQKEQKSKDIQYNQSSCASIASSQLRDQDLLKSQAKEETQFQQIHLGNRLANIYSNQHSISSKSNEGIFDSHNSTLQPSNSIKVISKRNSRLNTQNSNVQEPEQKITLNLRKIDSLAQFQKYSSCLKPADMFVLPQFVDKVDPEKSDISDLSLVKRDSTKDQIIDIFSELNSRSHLKSPIRSKQQSSGRRSYGSGRRLLGTIIRKISSQHLKSSIGGASSNHIRSGSRAKSGTGTPSHDRRTMISIKVPDVQSDEQRSVFISEMSDMNLVTDTISNCKSNQTPESSNINHDDNVQIPKININLVPVQCIDLGVLKKLSSQGASPRTPISDFMEMPYSSTPKKEFTPKIYEIKVEKKISTEIVRVNDFTSQPFKNEIRKNDSIMELIRLADPEHLNGFSSISTKNKGYVQQRHMRLSDESDCTLTDFYNNENQSFDKGTRNSFIPLGKGHKDSQLDFKRLGNVPSMEFDKALETSQTQEQSSLTLAKFLQDEKKGVKNMIENEMLFQQSDDNNLSKQQNPKKHRNSMDINLLDGTDEQKIPILNAFSNKQSTVSKDSRRNGIVPYNTKKVSFIITQEDQDSALPFREPEAQPLPNNMLSSSVSGQNLQEAPQAGFREPFKGKPKRIQSHEIQKDENYDLIILQRCIDQKLENDFIPKKKGCTCYKLCDKKQLMSEQKFKSNQQDKQFNLFGQISGYYQQITPFKMVSQLNDATKYSCNLCKLEKFQQKLKQLEAQKKNIWVQKKIDAIKNEIKTIVISNQ